MLSVITPDLINEGKAAERLAEIAGRSPLRCPACGRERPFKVSPCRCVVCGKKYTWRTGSIFEGTKLTAAELVILIDRLNADFTDKEIAESLKITADTVKVWRFKIELFGEGTVRRFRKYASALQTLPSPLPRKS